MNVLTDPAVVATFASGLALLFALAGTHKLRAPGQFLTALANYAVLPPAGLALTGRLLPWVELAIAFGLMHPRIRPFAAIGSAGILALYGWVMARAMAQGREIGDCGCSLGQEPHPVQWALVWRNLVLALLAVLVAAISAMSTSSALVARELSTYDLLTIALAVAMASLLYALLNTLITNHYRQRAFRHD